MSSTPNSDPANANHMATQSTPSLTRAELLGWATVRTALGQIVFAAFVMAILFGLMTYFPLLGERTGLIRRSEHWTRRLSACFECVGPFEYLMASAVMQALTIFLVIGNAFLCFFSVWGCGRAPVKFNGRRWAMAARICLICSVALYFIGVVAPSLERPELRSSIVNLGNPGVGGSTLPQLSNSTIEFIGKTLPYGLLTADLLAVTFFVVFLRRVAAISGESHRNAEAVIFLVVFAILIVANFVFTRLDFPTAFSPYYPTAFFAASAVMYGWFAVLTRRVQSALTHMLLEVKR